MLESRDDAASKEKKNVMGRIESNPFDFGSIVTYYWASRRTCVWVRQKLPLASIDVDKISCQTSKP